MVRPRSASQHPESWDPHGLPATQSTLDGKVSQSATTSAFFCRKKKIHGKLHIRVSSSGQWQALGH